MYYGWKPYVPVAKRRAAASKAMHTRAKKGMRVDPVTIDGRKIAKTFWGQRWCQAMEAEADFVNRIPRGQTYVRNGSVVHLEIAKGKVTAVVSGSTLYDVTVGVKPLAPARWAAIRSACGAGVSALSLLQGRLDDAVLHVLAAPGKGMIPESGDFTMRCSCPDWATLCKHVAAVLYGVGARLDRDPALLFTLRGVDMNELVAAAGSAVTKTRSKKAIDDDLATTFGIDLDDTSAPATAKTPAKTAKTAPAARPAKTAPAAKTAKTAPAPGALHTAAQLRDMGYSASAVKKLLAEGALVREGFGWYRFAQAPP